MADTLARLFRHTISYDKPDAILTKQDGAYRPISSREFFRRVGALHLELRNASLKKGDRCAILSENRWEWAVADFAMVTAGIVSVPLYPTQTSEQLQYMLEHSEAKIIAVSTQQQLD
jgi:long-chain acyl-CoA synthetase